MKKIALVLAGFIIFMNCATMMQLLNRTPSVNHNYKPNENIQVYTPDSTKLYEGMLMSMVRNNFGEPDSVKSGDEGFIIWQYPACELYFVDEVLINWKEWPPLKFESSQF